MLIKIVNHASRYMASTEESWFRLACAHDQIGEVAEAEHLYRSILERNAHYTPARLRLVALLRRDRYRDNDALALLDSGIAIAPYHSQLHSVRALVLISMKRHRDAQESLATACQDNRHDFDLLYHLGTLCNMEPDKTVSHETKLNQTCQVVEHRCNNKMK